MARSTSSCTMLALVLGLLSSFLSTPHAFKAQPRVALRGNSYRPRGSVPTVRATAPQNQSRSHVAEKRLCLASCLGINYYRNGKNDDLARLCCVSHESTQSRSFLLSLQLYCSSHPSRYMTIESLRTDLSFLSMIVFVLFSF